MENATQALEMAGAVMLFVLALSIILFSFGQARQSADIILNYRDRETMYIDGEYYYESTAVTERNVNLETMIPSIFRAYLENYKIVFDDNGQNIIQPLYEIKNLSGDWVPKYSLDLETSQDRNYRNVTLANDKAKIKFLKGIVYGEFDGDSKFAEYFNIRLPSNFTSLYNQLTKAVRNNHTITEHLGVYYQNDDKNVPDVMKTEKRIITYRIQ